MKLRYLRLHRLKRVALYSAVLLGLIYIVGFYQRSSQKASIVISENVSDLISELLDKNNHSANWKLLPPSPERQKQLHHDLTVLPSEYLALRQKYHHHDPRISFSALMHSLTQSSSAQEAIEFSWQDWVDLSALNPFLHQDTPASCESFINEGFNYREFTDYVNPDVTIQSGDDYPENFDGSDCLNNNQFLKTAIGQYHQEQLLPGFNFQRWMKAKRTFMEKFIFAKSLVLSGLKKPNKIVFQTNSNDIIEFHTKDGKSMSNNGVMKKYFESLEPNSDGKVQVDVTPLFDKFLKLYKPKNAKPQLQSDLQLNYEEFFLDVDYQPLTKEFKESIDFSQNENPLTAAKYFHEVNINFPKRYRGHQLTEDGGHYDYRFFDGFSTEIPQSLFKQHSPHRDPVNSYAYPENEEASEVFLYDSSTKRKRIILSHLIHSLLTFTYNTNHPLILAHGSLLSWYFNGLAFPWDNDSDVQMPINTLMSFCDNYNQSMIFQNPEYGLGKYFLDCSSYLTHRTKANGNNNIDARFIDIDSGFFVDITALSVSSDILTNKDWSKLSPLLPKGSYDSYPKRKPKVINPSSNKKAGSKDMIHLKYIDKEADDSFANGQRPELSDDLNDKLPKFDSTDVDIDVIFEFHSKAGIVNCRNRHFYIYEYLKDLELTKFENAPIYIPKGDYIETIIADEYTSNAIRKVSHDEYVFIEEFGIWVPAMDIFMACKESSKNYRNPVELLDSPLNPRNKYSTKGGTGKKSQKQKKNKKFKFTGETVNRCLNENRQSVLNHLLSINLKNTKDDEEFPQFNLLNQLNEVNAKSNGVEIAYLNVLEELISVKNSINYHKEEMNEIFGKKYVWKNTKFISPSLDQDQWQGPLRITLMDYLIEIEKDYPNNINI